ARPPVRRALSLADVAGMLEMRLFQPEVSAEHVAGQASHAADLGLAAVMCRPEHVATAAASVHGSPVGICVAVDFSQPAGPELDLPSLTDEAHRLARAGATSLALVVNAARMRHDTWTEALAMLARVAQETGATSRAMVDVRGMTLDQAVATAVRCQQAGAAVIQAGSWNNQGATFTLLGALRGALDPHITLKWTRPIRSIDALLLGVAEGGRLFNADVDSLIAEATRRQEWLPLNVPLPGYDY
ncbi:MAG TPA: hypothetical protein VGN48_11265, partial [Pedococcus sp.]|nr:hypothetical protein [Pedococcus sp.]